MTNLLFGTNIDALEATSSMQSSTESGYDTDNLWTGSRDLHWMADSAATNNYIGYRNAGTVVNYLAVCRADYYILAGTAPEFELKHCDDDASYSSWYDSGALDSSDLVGPNAQDYIYYNATSATDEYWRLYFTDSAAIQPEIAAVYFGQALDLGRDPDRIEHTITRVGQSFKKAIHEFYLSYLDISYTLTMQLINEVIERADYHPIVLFTAANHQVLLNMKMIQVRLLDAKTPQEIRNRNNITLSFREVL